MPTTSSPSLLPARNQVLKSISSLIKRNIQFSMMIRSIAISEKCIGNDTLHFVSYKLIKLSENIQSDIIKSRKLTVDYILKMALYINEYIKLRDIDIYMFNCCNQVNGELLPSSEIYFHLMILFSKFKNVSVDVDKFYNYFFYLQPFNFFNELVLKFIIFYYNLIYDGTFFYWHYTVKHHIFHISLYRDFDIKISNITFLNRSDNFLPELEH